MTSTFRLFLILLLATTAACGGSKKSSKKATELEACPSSFVTDYNAVVQAFGDLEANRVDKLEEQINAFETNHGSVQCFADEKAKTAFVTNQEEVLAAEEIAHWRKMLTKYKNHLEKGEDTKKKAASCDSQFVTAYHAIEKAASELDVKYQSYKKGTQSIPRSEMTAAIETTRDQAKEFGTTYKGLKCSADRIDTNAPKGKKEIVDVDAYVELIVGMCRGFLTKL